MTCIAPAAFPLAPTTTTPTDVLALLRVGLGRVRVAWDYVPYDAVDPNKYLYLRRRVCATLALWYDPATGEIDPWATRPLEPWDSCSDVTLALAVHALADQLPGGCDPLTVPSEQLIVFNDRQRDPAPVIDLYERAIARLEREVVGS